MSPKLFLISINLVVELVAEGKLFQMVYKTLILESKYSFHTHEPKSVRFSPGHIYFMLKRNSVTQRYSLLLPRYCKKFPLYLEIYAFNKEKYAARDHWAFTTLYHHYSEIYHKNLKEKQKY